VERARPPDDITPHEFFTDWVPRAVQEDPERRRRLGETHATIVFELHGDPLHGDPGGQFTVCIDAGRVTGREGAADGPDLHVSVDLETWRALNRGDTSAPQALLKRRVRLHGDYVLGLKLHFILG